ncbi:hypothetical protein NFJ02_11g06930 [Pycnococcus provasolii]
MVMTSSSVLAAAVCASVLASSAVDAVPSYRAIEKATPSISLNTLPAPILKSSTYSVNSDDEMMINRPFAMIEVFEDNKDMPQIIDISMMVVDDNVNSSSGFPSFFDNTFFDDFSMPSLYDLTMPMHDVFDDTFDSIQNFLSPVFSGEESLAATPDVDVGKKNMNMPTLPTRQVTLRDLTLPVHDFANSILKSIQNFVAPSPVADDDDNISDENGVVAQLDNEQHEEEEEEESTTKEEVNFKKPIWKDEDKEELLARAMLEV